MSRDFLGINPWTQMAMGQNPNRTPSEHPIQSPLKQVLKWVVHLPPNGTIGFDPQPNVVTVGCLLDRRAEKRRRS